MCTSFKMKTSVGNRISKLLGGTFSNNDVGIERFDLERNVSN